MVLRILAVLLFFPLAAAPVKSQESHIAVSRGFVRPAVGSLIVLLPPKAEESVLEPGLRFVVSELHGQLSRAGYKVAILDERNYQVIWHQEVLRAEVAAPEASRANRLELFARAITALAERVGQETRAAMILRPTLVARSATLQGTKASWDGQLRLIPLRGLAGDSARALRGSVPVMSIELLGLMGDGSVAFKAYGGASLLYVVNTISEKFELRSDLFASHEEIAEGIAITLQPIIASEAR